MATYYGKMSTSALSTCISSIGANPFVSIIAIYSKMMIADEKAWSKETTPQKNPRFSGENHSQARTSAAI